MSEPIEEYLDSLFEHLRGDPREARRLLDEATDHLYGTAEHLEASGMTRLEAESEAVRRFGASRPLARADAGRSFGRLVIDTGEAVTVLGAIGLVAIGLSGLVAAAMIALFGRGFVGGGLANSVFGGPPASVPEDAGDAVSLRVLAGVIGVLVLVGVWFARRAGVRLRVLPVVYVDVVALVCFSGATVGLAAAGIDQVVQHAGNGAGFFLSGALVALPAAVVFGFRSVRGVLTNPRN